MQFQETHSAGDWTKQAHRGKADISLGGEVWTRLDVATHTQGSPMSPAHPATLSDPSILKDLNLSQPLRKLVAFIDQLDVSADFKAILRDLAKVTWNVGSTVVAIGRKILSVALDIVTTFPGTLFGVVVASIVTLIVGTIPFVGPLLATFVGPMMLATGLTMGALSDFRSSAWSAKVAALQSQLAAIKV